MEEWHKMGYDQTLSNDNGMKLLWLDEINPNKAWFWVSHEDDQMKWV